MEGDDELANIQCDGCDGWFHLICLEDTHGIIITDEEAALLDSWYCPADAFKRQDEKAEAVREQAKEAKTIAEAKMAEAVANGLWRGGMSRKAKKIIRSVDFGVFCNVFRML
jgi:hypothetical protein